MTHYAGVFGDHVDVEKAYITMLDHRARRFFYFPPDACTCAQGDVPWPAAIARATHMLLDLQRD
jgi:hypothetical protein